LKQVILVEDDAGIRDAVMLLMETAGYAVTVYPSGAKIVSMEFVTPDIFILDNQLSGINGLELCRFLKSQPATASVPVIMLSASPSIGVLSAAAGANGYLEKPFTISTLRELVKKCIATTEN
jgi:DNA-binding response OmpR family regulator